MQNQANQSQMQANQSQMQAKQDQSQSNMEIFTISKNTYVNAECSICYKNIKKYYAICSAPCKKVFHTTCIEKMIAQTEAAANAEDEEVDYKCCYCRRSIDINHYDLQEVGRKLICLKNGGYDVSEALHHVKNQFANMVEYEGGDDVYYSIYFDAFSTHFQKKPKQTNRMPLKKINKQPRIHIKQNIGGRRRS